MHITGVVIGLFSFAIIGVFHPIVIKCEYHFSHRIWPIFLVVGVGAVILSLFFKAPLVSALFSILGFTCLWSIGELKEQAKRVEKGWFPSNPEKTK